MSQMALRRRSSVNATSLINVVAMWVLAFGAGLLILVGAGSAVASAAPSDPDHSAVTSTSRSHSGATSSRAATVRRTEVAAPHKNPIVIKAPVAADPTRSDSGISKPNDISLPIISGLDSLSRDLARRYDAGPAASQRALAAVPSTSAAPSFGDPGDIIYGDPAKNVEYWQYQGQTNTCVLVSSAMVVGQQTGKMPKFADIVKKAESIPSDTTARERNSKAYANTKAGVIFRGLRNGAIYQKKYDEYVYYVDAVKLLNTYGINATFNFYARNDGAYALSNLKSALGSDKSVIVSIHNWTAYYRIHGTRIKDGLW
ncbi:MAG: hypothetical protein ACR2JM_13230, partial [Mycobacterium sp.]